MASSTETVEKSEEKFLGDLRTVDFFEDAASTFVPTLKKSMSLSERKEAMRNIAQRITHMEDKIHAVQGEILYEISRNAYWREWSFEDSAGDTRCFRTFDEYIEQECEVSRRTAYYYIAVYQRLVIDIGIPAENMRQLDWSKAKEILPVVSTENWKDLLKTISKMKVREVREHVHSMKGIPGSSSTSTTTADFIRTNFMLTEDQHENVRQALDIAGSMSGSDKSGNQLDLICTSFVADSVGSGEEASLVQLDMIKRSIERTFGVKLEVVDVDTERY